MNTVKIGWARKEFSIDKPVNIPGQMYMRRSEGIMDPLYATALCIDGGKGMDAVIFCSLDITVIRGNIMFDTLDIIRQTRPDVPADSIILNATHTHASMDMCIEKEEFPDGSSIYNGKKVQPFMVKQIVAAICEAWDNRTEGGIAYGYGYAVVGHSRRSTYGVDMSLKIPNAAAPNGHGIMYGKTNDPDFFGYEAGADHFLNAMFTFDKNDKLTGMVINVPCPSQLSEHFKKLTADFWADVRQQIAKEYGDDIYVLSQCAAGGDISPRILHYLPAQQRRFRLKYGLESKGKENEYGKVMGERYDIAERITAAVKEIYSWASKDIKSEIPVRHEVRELALKRRMITDEEAKWCRDNIEEMRKRIPDISNATPEEITKAVSTYNSIKRRNESALDRYSWQNERPTINSIVHAVQIGEVGFATNRFELFMDFMHQMQARSPFIQTFVVQLAGDEGGSYLATERAVLNKGYSASLFCNQVSPEAGHQIVEASLEMLNDMKENDGVQQ